MKIRFHDNSLRIRLSNDEAASIATKPIEERIEFPNGGSLSVSLESGETPSARFEGNRIRVISPLRALDSGIEFANVLIEIDQDCKH